MTRAGHRDTLARRTTSSNAGSRPGSPLDLDLVDRDVGAGNSVFADQQLLVQARGLIPRDESFAVAAGDPQPGWTDLTAGSAEPFLRYYLLPRRLDPNARWIVCLGCDRGAYPGAAAVWEGEDGISILRRAS